MRVVNDLLLRLHRGGDTASAHSRRLDGDVQRLFAQASAIEGRGRSCCGALVGEIHEAHPTAGAAIVREHVDRQDSPQRREVLVQEELVRLRCQRLTIDSQACIR